jgi:hypothetical protein
LADDWLYRRPAGNCGAFFFGRWLMLGFRLSTKGTKITKEMHHYQFVPFVLFCGNQILKQVIDYGRNQT